MNNDSFVLNAQALLDLDKEGALVPHGIGGHARYLLEYAIGALTAPITPSPPTTPPAAEPGAVHLYWRNPKTGAIVSDIDVRFDGINTLGWELTTPPAPPTAPPAEEPGASVAWENFPSYLIDNCEGDTITEERLQRALAAMLQNPQYATTPSAPSTAQGLSDAEIQEVIDELWRSKGIIVYPQEGRIIARAILEANKGKTK